TIAQVETVTLSGTAAANSLSLTNSQAGTEIDGTARTDDALSLAAGGNSVTVGAIETITGGSGADTVVLSAALPGGTIDLAAGGDSLLLADGGNSVTVANVETLTGGSGADTVVLTTLVSGASVELAGGSDTLILANGAN